MEKFCVYTVLIGGYEKLNEQPVSRESDIDFICFTDNPDLESSTWKITHIDPLYPLDQVRSARHIKICAHNFVPNYLASLYIDNSVKLLLKPEVIFQELLPESADIALIAHSFRDTVLDEFIEVLNVHYDHPNLVTEQLNAYSIINEKTLYKKPFWTGFMLRRHMKKEIITAMDDWFFQVTRYSRRDQLSLNFVLSKHIISPVIYCFDNLASKYHQWPTAQRFGQKKVIEGAITASIGLGQQVVLQNKKINILQKELAETQTQLDANQTRLADTQSQFSETQTQLTETQTQLTETQTQLAEVNLNLSEIRKSKAWKFAMLIRKLKKIMLPSKS